jgi:hypothetical protein
VLKRLLIIFGLLIPLLMEGQSLEKLGDNAKKGLLYEKDYSLGFRLNTNGWSIFANFSRNISQKKARFYQFEFIELKSNKEQKSRNDFFVSNSYNPKPFIFGKQNNFYALHAYYGRRIILGEKAEKSGIEVNFVYQGGISLGISKPYYLDVVELDDAGKYVIKQIRYSEGTHEQFMNVNTILGSSGFNKGFGQISLYPGVTGKAGFNFDWANYSNVVRALEVGVSLDLYYRNIPIMVSETNRPYFFYFYLGIQFGKRW